MAKRSFDPAVAETVIAHGLSVKGHLECSGDLWLDGTVEGNITAAGNVIIGVNGTVRGHIKAANITLGGQLNGNLTATGTATVEQSGNITGDIKCETLVVADGAALHGQVAAGTRQRSEQAAPPAANET